MSFLSSISLKRCFRARWLMPGFSTLPWKIKGCLACSLHYGSSLYGHINAKTIVYLHGVSFSRASLSIGKYADMVAIDAGRHKRLDLLKDLMKADEGLRVLVTVLFPAHAVHFYTSSCVAWGWKTLSSSKMRPFPLFSTLSEDSLLGSVVTTTDWPSSCWSSFSTGFTRHSTRMLPKERGGSS